ncbi:MAG: MotA/TolQ/ExbB proton channel family protein [Spirochaetes bacterium]|nr:MotA/TolQ/ExbB proton channel family protein [Spirochaetota bacterium]
MIDFFTSFSMWVTIVPIVFCSVISAAAIIERLVFFRKINYDYQNILKNVVQMVKSNKFTDAYILCEQYRGPVAMIIKNALRLDIATDERENEILRSSRAAIKEIEKHVGIIATVATVSPLLGLFGTVTGLLKSFVALYKGGPDASSLLSYGVAEALLTTILGLLVAIPSWIFYNFLVSRVEGYIREIEFIANSLSQLK